MGHRAVIGPNNRPAPSVKAGIRVTPSQQAIKGEHLAGPVTVEELDIMDARYIALMMKGDSGASIDKHGSRGAISGKGLNGVGQTILGTHLSDALKFRPIKTASGSVSREELRIAAGIVIFRQASINKERVWVGELRSAGKTTRQFVGITAWGKIMGKSDARDALLNKIQSGGLSLF